MVIYRATNIYNNRCYIGQTTNKFWKRKTQHLSDAKRNVYPNYYFHRALRKYGKTAFKWEILHDNVINIDSLNILEELEIIINDSFYNGYNMTKGGEGFLEHKHSQETKNKISKNNAKYWKGKEVPEEMRKKISETLKGRYTGDKNPFYGKKHTDETKEIISLRGKKRPLNTYYKKSVLQLDKNNGEIIKKWNSISDAKKALKINNICACFNGKQKTCGGFLWVLEKNYNIDHVNEKIYNNTKVLI